MWHRRFLAMAALAAILTMTSPGHADKKKAAADQEQEKASKEDLQGEDLLKGEGLRRIGQFYVLSEEVGLAKLLRETEATHKKVTDAEQKAVAAEKKVDGKKQAIIDCLQERRRLMAQMDQTRNVNEKNRMVTRINELGDRAQVMDRSDQYEKEAKTAREVAVQVSEQYVEKIIQLRKQYREMKAKYEKLAANKKIQEAIDAVNKEDSTSYQLGPSRGFTQADKNLRKLEGSVLSESIPLRRSSGDTWNISATINGKHSLTLMLDTGASLIALPYKTATEIGLTPSSNDPTITCVLANGQKVDAKLVYAKSVRVGKFLVEHVECGVMPQECTAAEPLLGQAFLKHFSYKVDSAKGKLVLTQIEQPGAKKRVTQVDSPESQPDDAKTAKADDSDKEKGGKVADKAADEKADGKGGAELAVKLLKVEGAKPQQGLVMQGPGGQALRFEPAKEMAVSDLSKRLGDPDQVVKIPVTAESNGEKKTLSWKLWTWGSVNVMADENGKTRFYAVIQNKN